MPPDRAEAIEIGHLHRIHPRQIGSEQSKLDRLIEERIEGGGTICDEPNLMALPFQNLADYPGDGAIVVGDEGWYGRSSSEHRVSRWLSRDLGESRTRCA